MAINLGSLIATGLLMAFLLPVLAYVSATLPNPTTSSGTYNYTANFTGTGGYLFGQINSTFGSLTTTLVGTNCTGPGSSQSTCNTKNASFSANPTIFSAYAFIISGLGTIMTILIQLPYLDYISIQFLTYGLYTSIPFIPLGFIQVGAYILYIYMGIMLLIQGLSYVGKYNLGEASS